MVVGDDEVARAGHTPTLALLADAAQGRLSAPVVADGDLHSGAESAVHAALTAAGLAPLVKPLVHGHELDLAVLDADGQTGVDIEVDGAHHTDDGGRQRRADLARDAVLRRAGWTVLRVPAWRALDQPGRWLSGWPGRSGNAHAM